VSTFPFPYTKWQLWKTIRYSRLFQEFYVQNEMRGTCESIYFLTFTHDLQGLLSSIASSSFPRIYAEMRTCKYDFKCYIKLQNTIPPSDLKCQLVMSFIVTAALARNISSHLTRWNVKRQNIFRISDCQNLIFHLVLMNIFFRVMCFCCSCSATSFSLFNHHFPHSPFILLCFEIFVE